ncbi:hypothetical protein HGRIS_004541 [Hohenbuehelia grisea]|uniref:C2H2-type domain-containing protein n=1 Tax=Hohenbuehelia grisea TaxID=104357 RepID=A0ABR3JCF3_9AGAR
MPPTALSTSRLSNFSIPTPHRRVLPQRDRTRRYGVIFDSCQYPVLPLHSGKGLASEGCGEDQQAHATPGERTADRISALSNTAIEGHPPCATYQFVLTDGGSLIDKNSKAADSTSAMSASPSADCSTWEFGGTTLAPKIGGARNSSSPVCGTTTAQRIAHLYRTGRNLGEIDAAESVSDEDTTLDSIDPQIPGPNLNSAALVRRGPNPPVRRPQSRSQALETASNEAYAAMTKNRVGPEDAVPCPRKACRASLPNVLALMYHLDLHDIDKKAEIYASSSVGTVAENTRRDVSAACTPVLPNTLYLSCGVPWMGCSAFFPK